MKKLLLWLLFVPCLAFAAPLPSIDTPLRTNQQASHDAAVVIGVEDYPLLGETFHVPYAARDADSFEQFLIYTRGIPPKNVHRLSAKSTKEEIEAAFSEAAKEASDMLWFYFAGHGAAHPKTHDQQLLAADTPQDARFQAARMVSLSNLQAIADKSSAKQSIFVIDACAEETGQRFVAPVSLAVQPESQNVLWMAAKFGQRSGSIDQAQHGAFTYALLGALRGWADGEVSGRRDGQVTLEEAHQYVVRALKELNIRSQEPELIYRKDAVLSFGQETEVIPTGAALSAEVKSENLAASSENQPAPALRVSGKKPVIDYIKIKGDRFMMGSNVGEEDARPMHPVDVPTFEIGRTEVTVGQYRLCVKAGVCSAPMLITKDAECNYSPEPGPYEDHPVNCVSWNQALTFAEWVGARLPSEAEWEYAARSATARRFPWGESLPNPSRANYGHPKERTAPVCQYKGDRTPEGLCDMEGNVAEWVMDSYLAGYGTQPVDGKPYMAGSRSDRVIKGAAWDSSADFDYTTYDRSYNGPNDQLSSMGFRLVRSKD